MNRITKTMRKGFTLIELMVVMAIMSVLLLALLSMTTPASRIFKRTAISDNVYSAADNITGYLQRTLEYADNVWIFDSDEKEATDLEDTANKFRNCYYKGVIKGVSETQWKYVGGKVHVLKICNTGDDAGQIKESVYKYSDSNGPSIVFDKIKVNGVNVDYKEVNVLNQNYFKGDYKDYNFRYALGASTLAPVLETGGDKKMVGSEIVYCLKSETDNGFGGVGNVAITLVANRSTTKPAKVDGVTEFVGPCVASVANLPLTNITSRKSSDGTILSNVPVYRLISPDGTNIFSQKDTAHIPADYLVSYSRDNGDIVKSSFACFSTTKNLSNQDIYNVSLEKDIYIVYAYADELQPIT